MTPDATPTPVPPELIIVGSEHITQAGNFSLVSNNKTVLQIDSEGKVVISPYITLEDLAEVIRILREQCNK